MSFGECRLGFNVTYSDLTPISGSQDKIFDSQVNAIPTDAKPENNGGQHSIIAKVRVKVSFTRSHVLLHVIMRLLKFDCHYGAV